MGSYEPANSLLPINSIIFFPAVIKINNIIVEDENKILQSNDFENNILKISYGKKKHYLIKII